MWRFTDLLVSNAQVYTRELNILQYMDQSNLFTVGRPYLHTHAISRNIDLGNGAPYVRLSSTFLL